jgi:hypothetical protein
VDLLHENARTIHVLHGIVQVNNNVAAEEGTDKAASNSGRVERPSVYVLPSCAVNGSLLEELPVLSLLLGVKSEISIVSCQGNIIDKHLFLC